MNSLLECLQHIRDPFLPPFHLVDVTDDCRETVRVLLQIVIFVRDLHQNELYDNMLR